MEAKVDTLCLLAQPELTENRMARKSDTKAIKKKHSSRLVGGAEGQPGWRGLVLPWRDRDWRSVEQTAKAVWPLADPAALHSHTDKPDKWRGAEQTTQPRAPAQGNKASNL